MITPVRRIDYAAVRAALLLRSEIALLDVREEEPHAQAHPLFAADFPLSRIEMDAYTILPRRDVLIVTIGDGEGEAEQAARRLVEIGYTDVAVFADGIAGWAAAGGELFRDVNVPSKAFGELVESKRHTPSLSAGEVQALIDRKADIVIVDVRRFDEYQTMSIPTATSVPGAELVLRVSTLAPDPNTRVIVNCAGRTRSIIGTQSLVNAGLPNPVAALRNGTIGWTLAGQALDTQRARRFGPTPPAVRERAAASARTVADRAGVRRANLPDIAGWQRQQGRTTYCFDVRSLEEYEAGHLPGFRSTPGGQLVQETEMAAPVRGARIVLVDDDGVRANMTGSWLAQMGWEVHVLDAPPTAAFSQTGAWSAPRPRAPQVPLISASALQTRRTAGEAIAVIDLTSSANHRKAHIPGAWYAIRAYLRAALPRIPAAQTYVLTCGSGALAAFAVPELQALVDAPVLLLEGGTQAWKEAGLPLESGLEHAATDPIDRYRRPYEGTENAQEAMQSYLDWEFGLVEQLARDGTHGFFVL